MKPLALILTAAVSLVTLTGCDLSLNPNKHTNEQPPQSANATANTVANGLAQLGDASVEQFNLSEAQRAAGDTIVININGVIVRWHYDSALQAWIREAKWKVNADSIACYDSVRFLDQNNQGMKIPTLAATAKLQHFRTVVGSYQTVPYNYRYAMNVDIDKSTKDTFFVFNGSLTGTYNNENINTTVITDVKRKLDRFPVTHLDYPVSGTIDIDVPQYTIHITFGGSNTVQAVITRKSDGKTWIINVQIQISYF